MGLFASHQAVVAVGGGSDSHSINQIRALISEIAPENLSDDFDFVVAGLQADLLDQAVQRVRDRTAQPDIGLSFWPGAIDWVGSVLMAHRNGGADPNSAQLRTPQLVRVP